MLKKLNLDGTKLYEIAIGCDRLTAMLSAMIDGRGGSKALGVEQGDIETWDDLVEQTEVDSLVHYQVKRNNTHFSPYKPARGNMPRAGRPEDLSPLDKSILELGKWAVSVDLVNHMPKRRFVIALPDGEINIKDGITVNALRVLCNEKIKSASTLDLFEKLIDNDNQTKEIVTWLTSWCDFADNKQIFEVLKRLEVWRLGSQLDVENVTKSTLSRYFSDTERVYLMLQGYMLATSGFTTALTPRAVFELLAPFILPTLKDWTQYSEARNGYEKRGIFDKRPGSIEHPSAIVKGLWSGQNPGILKLSARPNLDEKLPRAILRLAIHLQRGSEAHIADHAAWKQSVNGAVGGTLGLDSNDFDTLAMMDAPALMGGSDCSPYNTSADRDREADELSNEMQKELWEKVCLDVNDRLAKLAGSPLKNAIEKRWTAWKAILDADLTHQYLLCCSMLKPEAEGEEIMIEFRIGPKNSHLIGNGIYCLLAVSVALTDDDMSWTKISDELDVLVRANRYWSGPSGTKRSPRKLSDAGREKFLAAEPSKVLILSESDSSPTEIREYNMATTNQADNLAAERQPRIIVTSCYKFNELIRQGDIKQLSEYLNEQIKSHEV